MSTMSVRDSALDNEDSSIELNRKTSEQVEYDIADVESQIIDAATALHAIYPTTTVQTYVFDAKRLSRLTPANQLKIMQAHLSRLEKRIAMASTSTLAQQQSSHGELPQNGAMRTETSVRCTLALRNPQVDPPPDSNPVNLAMRTEASSKSDGGGSLSASYQTIPPLPPHLLKLRSGKSQERADQLWRFLVETHLNPCLLQSYKDRFGKVMREKLLEAFGTKNSV